MITMIDILWKDLGYIDCKLGYSFPGQDASRNARMIATDKLLNLLFKEFEINPAEIGSNPEEKLIVLKNEDKEPIEYEITANVQQMTDNLTIINNRISQHFIGLCVPDKILKVINVRHRKKDRKSYIVKVDFTKTKLSRIFNNSSFVQGGRFYGGWWQAVPSKYRPYIRIDNNITREVDFKGLHINLLYAEEGLPIPADDVYTLEGIPVEARPMLKKALQAILNSDDENKALWTIKNEFPKHKHPAIFHNLTHEQIIEEFRQKHRGIEHYFYKGKGVHLQFIDSQIAEHVMLSLDEQGIPTLPVHDSFIVARQHEGALIDTMNAALMRRYEQEFKLTKDDTAYELDLEVLRDNASEEDLPTSAEEYEDNWTSEQCGEYISRLRSWQEKKFVKDQEG